MSLGQKQNSPCGMSIGIRDPEKNKKKLSGPQTEKFLQELTQLTTHCVPLKQKAHACNLGGSVCLKAPTSLANIDAS